MSGIAGIIDFRGGFVDSAQLYRMTEAMKHRGGKGVSTGVSCGMAFGHIAMVGEEPLSQPFTRQYGEHRYTVVFDGLLRNARALKCELLSRGHIFCSHTDAEIILCSYIEWGVSCAAHFKGPFALALWDDEKATLLLARDGIGVRPLFVSKEGRRIAFSSEIKGLLAADCAKPRVDRDGLARLFALSPASPPARTLYADIDAIKPGCCAVYTPMGVFENTFFSLRCAEHADSETETVERVRSMVKENLQAALAGCERVCCLLSGGLDSSLLCALAAEELRRKGQRLMTYSVEYESSAEHFKPNDFERGADSEYTGVVARHIDCENAVITLSSAELARALKDAVIARDMPGMADVDSSLLLVCREIKKSHDAVISGECADEIFCGYPWFHRPMSDGAFPWSGSLELRRAVAAPWLREQITRCADEAFGEAGYSLELPRSMDDAERSRRALYQADLEWFGANLIDRTDRMSMASGLSARMPFADAELAQYAFNMPVDILNSGGRTKGVLREAARGLLPAAVTERVKSPYPKTHNPQYAAMVSDILLRLLKSRNAPIKELVDADAIVSYIENGVPAASPWYGQLMTGPQLFAFLIQINIWLSEYNVELIV